MHCASPICWAPILACPLAHNVLLRMLRTRTLAPFIRLCLLPSAWLRAATLPFWAYGSFVRGLRRLVGVQKLR